MGNAASREPQAHSSAVGTALGAEAEAEIASNRAITAKLCGDICALNIALVEQQKDYVDSIVCIRSNHNNNHVMPQSCKAGLLQNVYGDSDLELNL